MVDSARSRRELYKSDVRKLQEFPRLCVATIKSFEGEMEEFKDLKRMIMARSEGSLFDTVIKLR